MGDLTSKRAQAPAPLDLVEAFINSADLETGSDELATVSGLRAWLRQHQLITRAESVGDRDRVQAIRLRETLRRAALANNGTVADRRTMRELNQLARDARMVVVFGSDGTAHLDPTVRGARAGLARILAAVLVAKLTGQWSRLKSCASETCHWAFYDASKNQSARWCDMADCGNAAKGRAYRARRRAEAS